MKVIQTVPYIGDESSGPSYSVPGLCAGLMQNGVSVELHFLGPKPRRKFDFPVSVYPRHKFPHPRLGRSPEMLEGLIAACQTADIIHNNSLWMYPNVYPALAARRSQGRCKLVMAPRGTLAEWAMKHHRMQKRLFGLYAQDAALKATDMFHATCQKEYEEIRAAGYKQPVAIVPIGMTLPNVSHESCPRDRYMRRVVFFGRLHRVKAVDNLIRAWGRCARPGWELVIAGPDCGSRAELETIVQDENVPRVSFVGEINGEEKYRFLADADIYVLPSHTENFGITVAEALACGTPVIASQGTPWSGIEAVRAGKWVAVGAEPLAQALAALMALDDASRQKMGDCGRTWIQRDFSWNGVGAKMKAAYEWLLKGGQCPEYVKRD